MTAPRPIPELAAMIRSIADQLYTVADHCMEQHLARKGGNTLAYDPGYVIGIGLEPLLPRLKAIEALGSDARDPVYSRLTSDEITTLYWIALGVRSRYAKTFARLGLDSIRTAETKTEAELYQNKFVARKTLKALREVLEDNGTSLSTKPKEA